MPRVRFGRLKSARAPLPAAKSQRGWTRSFICPAARRQQQHMGLLQEEISSWGYYSGLATAIFPREICRISSWGVRVYAAPLDRISLNISTERAQGHFLSPPSAHQRTYPIRHRSKRNWRHRKWPWRLMRP
jgi:hypothetical protein